MIREPQLAESADPESRPIIEYASSDTIQKSVVPGRAALCCTIGALLFYGVLLGLFDGDGDSDANTLAALLLLLFAAGFIISIFAIARRRSRTVPAWIAFAVGAAWWLFYFSAMFSGTW